nr:Gag-Pol polyprotein [Tanacetum cinerariifolium]
MAGKRRKNGACSGGKHCALHSVSKEISIDNTKTRRAQPRSNTKNDRVPSASKSSQSKNKQVEVEEHHRNLLLSKNSKHMSSNNFKLDSQNVYSKVVYAMCYPDLFMVCRLGLFQAHDLKSKSSHQFRLEVYGNCLPKFKYHKEHICPSCEQGKSKRASHPPKPVPNSRQRLHLLHMDLCSPMRIASINRKQKHKENVSKNETQQKNQPKIKKSKKVGFIKRLATPKPRKSRILLRWSPTGRLFDQDSKISDSSESKSQSDCFNGDNACTSNTLQPKNKQFLNSNSLLGRVIVEGGLLASFQDLEHEGGDTRSQGGIILKDKDLEIFVDRDQDLRSQACKRIFKRIPGNTRLQVSRRFKKDSQLNDHPLRGDC